MLQRAKAVVVGGGVVGASVLYHLAKVGGPRWVDAGLLLLERRVLTAGSTWHAAGGFHAINSDVNISSLQKYTIALYEELEEFSGQSCGLHLTGGVNIASTPERWQFLQQEAARHRTMGLQTRLVSKEEIAEILPMMDLDAPIAGGKVLGGLWDDNEGHLDPSGVTNAYAKSARKLGAHIREHTKVDALTQRADGSWDVVTEAGVVHADHVINCGGLWAREVGAMAGVPDLPLLPMSHHYVMTGPIESVSTYERDMGRPFPMVMDLDGESYMRAEGQGMLLGVYEQDCVPWAVETTPWSWAESDLLPDDIPRLTPTLEPLFERYKVIADAGLKRAINGPFTFAPDGNPLVGPTPGVRCFWQACAVMAGFAQAGGVGLTLAEWMVTGQPSRDIAAMDVARFGPWATRPYTLLKAQENYRRRFRLAYPNEELPEGRPGKTSAVHDLMAGKNAVFGVAYGLEYPLWFAPEGTDAVERVTLNPRHSNAFSPVGDEVRALRGGVGMIETTGFAKYEVTGPGARAWLDSLLACKLPRPGRAGLAPMLAHTGQLLGDLTVMNVGPDVAAPHTGYADISSERWLLFGSGYMQGVHMRWFRQRLRESGLADSADTAVNLRNVSDDIGGFAIAGPQSHVLLRRLLGVADGDEAAALDLRPASKGAPAFRFMDVRNLRLGRAGVPAVVARLSVTGELGYELHVSTSYLRTLYHDIVAAAAGDGHYRGLATMGPLGTDASGCALVGVRALLSMRMEKAFGIWSTEFTPDYTAHSSGLSRFVDFSEGKPAFTGRELATAAEAAFRGGDVEGRHPGLQKHVCVPLELLSGEGALGVDAVGYEPLFLSGTSARRETEPVGFVTSCEYGHATEKCLAMGYVERAVVQHALDGGGDALEVQILGGTYPARVLPGPAFDPEGGRMRGDY